MKQLNEVYNLHGFFNMISKQLPSQPLIDI